MNTGITDKMLLACLLLVTFVDGHNHTKLRKKLTIVDYIKPKPHFVLPEQSAFHKVSVKMTDLIVVNLADTWFY